MIYHIIYLYQDYLQFDFRSPQSTSISTVQAGSISTVSEASVTSDANGKFTTELEGPSLSKKEVPSMILDENCAQLALPKGIFLSEKKQMYRHHQQVEKLSHSGSKLQKNC